MGKFRRKDRQITQEELWVRPQELVRGPVDGFYARLNGVLEKAGFTESVHRLCDPYYKTGGRPPVDPAVMFKMLIAGFLAGSGSERGIAARCADWSSPGKVDCARAVVFGVSLDVDSVFGSDV